MLPKLRHHHVLERAIHFLRAWQQLAAGDKFGGTTEEEFETQIARAHEAREEVKRAEIRLRALRFHRQEAEGELAGTVIRLGHGVIGHPRHGEGSVFHRTLGFRPRAGGRPRKEG